MPFLAQNPHVVRKSSRTKKSHTFHAYTTIIMPLSNAQLKAFWTNAAQMGLSDRTRSQLAVEGLATPEDFEDFTEEADLDGLFKLLAKPPKEMSGTGATATLTEVAAFVVPAKTMIRMHGVRLILAYYRLVGRDVNADDLFWPVVKSFVEQWKALLEKKKADVGQPPKLTKDKLIYKWLESFEQYLSDKIGVRNAPLTYLTRPTVAAPALLAREPDEPFSSNFASIEEELKNCVRHSHNLYKADNNALFQMLDRSTSGHDVGATIAPFRRTQDGRGAILAIKGQHAGRHVWDKLVKDANIVLQTRTWTGTTSITLSQHTSGQRKAYIQLTEAAVHAPADVPNNRQRVTYLLDSMKTENPKVLAGIAAIEQDETGKRVSFEDASTFLLPSCPVTAKNVKQQGLGAKVSGAAATTPPEGGPVPLGKTGVELRFHAPDKFAKLSKEQKAELSVWNRANPSHGGGKKRTRGGAMTTAKKAKVAAAKATEVISAMVESHAAELAAMSAKISAFGTMPPTVTPTGRPSGPAPAFIPPGGSYGPSQYDLDEKARVASLKLQSILKPTAKKGKKTDS